MPQNTSESPKFSKKNFKKFFLKICTIQNFLKLIFVFRRPKSIRKKYFQASRKNLLDSVSAELLENGNMNFEKIKFDFYITQSNKILPPSWTYFFLMDLGLLNTKMNFKKFCMVQILRKNFLKIFFWKFGGSLVFSGITSVSVDRF